MGIENTKINVATTQILEEYKKVQDILTIDEFLSLRKCAINELKEKVSFEEKQNNIVKEDTNKNNDLENIQATIQGLVDKISSITSTTKKNEEDILTIKNLIQDLNKKVSDTNKIASAPQVSQNTTIVQDKAIEQEIPKSEPKSNISDADREELELFNRLKD